MPATTNNGSSAQPAASAAASVAPQTEVNELNQRELLDKVSLDFLDGPPPVQKPEAQKAVKPEKAEAPAATVEEPAPSQEEQETPVEDQDPGDEAPEKVFESDAQVPDWLKGALDKLPEGHWSRERIPKLIEKALEKSKTLAEKEARVAELEEKLAEVRATEPASAGLADARGTFRNIEDPAQIQANLKAAEAWYQWAVSVKPDEFGSIPNPETKDGEDWTLADVHRRIQESDHIRRAAKAQLDYLNDYGKTHQEVKKQFPALFDLKSEERKLAQYFMDKMPWLDSRGDKEAILARLVLGEQVLQKRAKGVQTVDVSATATPKAAAPAIKSAPVVSSAPLRTAGKAPDLNELRNRIQQGDHAAREEMAALFLS